MVFCLHWPLFRGFHGWISAVYTVAALTRVHWHLCEIKPESNHQGRLWWRNGRTACLCSASTERACASFTRGHSTLNEASQKVFAPNKTKIITIPHLSGITTCICHYDLHRFPDSILLRHWQPALFPPFFVLYICFHLLFFLLLYSKKRFCTLKQDSVELFASLFLTSIPIHYDA